MNRNNLKYLSLLLLTLYLVNIDHQLITSTLHFSAHTIENIKTHHHIKYHHHHHGDEHLHTHTHNHLDQFELSFHQHETDDKKKQHTIINVKTDKHLYPIFKIKPIINEAYNQNHLIIHNSLYKIFIDVPFPPPRNLF